MRMLLLYILFALLSQQTTVNGQQTPFLESENLKTSKSEKVLKIFQVFNFSDSQIQKDSQVFNFSDSQILYYESQIRLADSLYKNYLPQYNFEEVKKAVEFFDSLRLTTDNSQQTTDSSDSEKRLKAKDKSLKISVAEPVEAPNDGIVPSTSSGTAYPKTVDCCLYQLS